MFEVIWKPSDKLGEDGKVLKETKFKGEVKIKLITRSERLKLMDACGVGLDRNNEIVFEKSMLASLAAGTELAAKHISEVDLKNVETGEEYKSYDDLAIDPDADEVVYSLLVDLWKGIKPSKKPKP